MINEAFQNTLNPKIWDKDNSLNVNVKNKILEIVKYFNEYVTIPLNMLDM